MARKITTLYLRDNGISLLVVEGKQVRKWATLPLEPGLVSQGVVLDETQVADRIRELFKLEKVSTSKVIVGLSGQDSLYRIITLPELPEAVIGEGIKREARRVLPVSLDDVYLSYQLLPAAAREEMSVFLAAFPRNAADSLIRTLGQAGIEPYIMDLAPLALCRVPDAPRAVIINVDLDHLDIMIVGERLPQLIRSLALPTEADSLSERVPVITEEFDRTVAFYNSSHRDEPIDETVPVFVCGDLEKAPESWRAVVGEESYPVSLLPLPLESPEDFSPSEFTVNIGLALKELRTGKEGANFSLINLNVLPGVYESKPISVTRILVPIGILAGLTILVYGGLLVQRSMADTAALRPQLPPIESQIAQTQRDVVALNEQIKPVEVTGETLGTTLTTLKEGREKFDGDLSEVVCLQPEEITLSSVNHSGSQVTLSGTAPGEDKIFSYARDLRGSGRFPLVVISSITVKTVEGEGEEELQQYSFELLLK